MFVKQILCIFSEIFGNTLLRVKKIGSFEKVSFLYCRRCQLCRAGIPLARPQSQQYVLCRWSVLSIIGSAAENGKQADSARTSPCRRRDHYHCGVGHRLACKPEFHRLGLPAAPGKFLGSDLPALHPYVAAGKSVCYVLLQKAG